jgi:C4-dicarboxylate transporter, DctM subunit
MRRAVATAAAAGRWAEHALTGAALLAMGLLPVLELLLRTVANKGIPGSSGYVQHLTLWVGFLGAMVAARSGRHLSLSTGVALLPPGAKRIAEPLTAAVSTAVATGLAWAAWQFVLAERGSPSVLGGWLPLWIVYAILPVSFAVVAVRFVLGAGGWAARGIALLGVPAAAAAGFLLADHGAAVLLPGVGVLILSAALGAPIFVILGGIALLLFFSDGVPVAAIPVETVRMVVSPFLPTIPLFTLTGYLLAESGASQRLIRVFRALFSWMPGGLAIMATLVCAFFTTFTGASGVTILALGGLLLPALVSSGYRERFAIGLVTSTGSIGLLFPPSLAVILYAVIARIPIPDLFLAGLIPGALLLVAIGILGVREGLRPEVARPPFDPREAGRALWAAKWELAIPLVPLVGLFGGFCTLVEAAALTVTYTLIVEVLIHRDLHVSRDLPGVLIKCVTLLGGVLVILGVAMGLTNYLVDAEVPMKAAEWVESRIGSRLLFLLVLNLCLLLVGCVMDIYAAIVVVVPLLLPVAEVFDIHPLHLGVIFLANLQLGYLTPPVGMNLFLASYRFERPLGQIYRHAVPFLIALLVVVLLVTYVPALTTWPGAEAPPVPGLLEDGPSLQDLLDEL